MKPVQQGAGAVRVGQKNKRKMRTSPSPLQLWYDTPATEWTEALPIGNGRIGAMIFGGTAQERLQLNEESLWSGTPHDYSHPGGVDVLPEIRRLIFAGEWEQAQKLIDDQFMGVPVRQSAYQTVGDLFLDCGADEATDYSRVLDIDTATATTRYTLHGVQYTRSYFASYPDDVTVVRLSADKPGMVSFTARYETPQPDTETTVQGDLLALSRFPPKTGNTPARIGFHAAVRIVPEGKNAKVGAGEKNTLVVSNADAVTLHLCIATTYTSYKDIGGDAVARVEKRLAAVHGK